MTPNNIPKGSTCFVNDEGIMELTTPDGTVYRWSVEADEWLPYTPEQAP